MKLSPLLNFEGDATDAMIDLTVNTVRSFHRTRVITPREIGPPEMAIDVPEATQTRLDQTVKNWRLGQTLVISAGIHPGVLDKKFDGFKYDINAYLAHLGPQAPVKSLADIIASRKFYPPLEKALRDSEAQPPPDQNPKCRAGDENARRLGEGVLKAMDDARLDALVYPTWNNPPRLIGDLNSPDGNNSNRIAPHPVTPVTSTATRGRRRQRTVARPARTATPRAPGLSRSPAWRTTAPPRRSSPAPRTFCPGDVAAWTSTSPRTR